MDNNKLFIFEYASGGGFNKQEIPSSLFCEGYGMLRSIIADFNEINFEISTLIDHRISFLSKYLKADSIKQVNAKDDYLKKYRECVKECNYIFIIAPEFSNILYDLTKIAKDHNKTILSVDLEGIKLGTSKIKTYKFFKKNKIKTPKTYQIPFKDNFLDLDFILQKFNELKSPIVIKPEDGVGAESIYYFESGDELKAFFKKLSNNIESNRIYILQDYIKGKDLSLSLISSSNILNQEFNNLIILSVNSQHVNIKDLKSDSEYFGGHTPVESYTEIIMEIAPFLKKLDLSKFNGYFGIDFIRKNDKSLYFIEINPRLTTSYIGLRNVVDKNIADLIFNLKLNLSNSPELNIRNYSIFSRLDLLYVGDKSTLEIKEEVIPMLIKEIPELITPPISFDTSDKNKYFSCFITTKTADLKSSRNRINEINTILKINNFYQIKEI